MNQLNYLKNIERLPSCLLGSLRKFKTWKNFIKKKKARMFEAKLSEGYVFKKIIDAIKDVVNEVNLQIDARGKSFWFMVRQTFVCRHLLASNGLISRGSRFIAPELWGFWQIHLSSVACHRYQYPESIQSSSIGRLRRLDLPHAQWQQPRCARHFARKSKDW